MSQLIKLLERVLGILLTSRSKVRDSPAGKLVSPRRLLRSSRRGWKVSGDKSVSLDESFRGSMIIGGSGSGKTRRVIIPNILKLDGSMVIHDPSFELLRDTGLELVKKGFKVLVFNPSSYSLSTCFNPLAGVSEIGQINVLADRIIGLAYQGHEGDAFWTGAAKEFVSMCLRAIQALPEVYRNLPNLYHFINQFEENPRVVELMFRENPNPTIWGSYLSFQKYDDKLRAGIIATVKNALAYLSDDNIGRILSKDGISAQILRKEKVALFIQTNTANQSYYFLVSSLLLDSLFSQILQNPPEESDHNLFFLLDEAATLSCPSLSQAMANVRKYRVGVLLALQDFGQLVSRYGIHDSEAIRSNSFTQLIFPGSTLETAQYYEKLLGMTEFRSDTGLQGMAPVLTAQELRELPSDQALLVLGNKGGAIVTTKIHKKLRVAKRISRVAGTIPPPLLLFNYSNKPHDQ